MAKIATISFENIFLKTGISPNAVTGRLNEYLVDSFAFFVFPAIAEFCNWVSSKSFFGSIVAFFKENSVCSVEQKRTHPN
jgi:hypothetical protein